MSFKRISNASFPCNFKRLSVALSLVACGQAGSQTTVNSAVSDPAALAARRDRWLAWEAKPAPKHHVELPDGLGSVDAESATPPKVECGKDSDGDSNCNVRLSIGLDEDGDEHDVLCRVLWYSRPLPFGASVSSHTESSVLEETPLAEVHAGPSGGVTASFMANANTEHDGKPFQSTIKYAAHYKPGITASCWDTGSGARKTFARVSEGFFNSLVIKKGNTDGVLYETASKVRKGDTTLGFSYAFVRKNEEGTLTETHMSYTLTADEKQWHSTDGERAVERSTVGSMETYRTAFMIGKAGVLLSAKPAEGGRVRLKLEANGRSDALEVTPQVPLSTEVWEAKALLRVAAGVQPSHRYAFLAASDDGEPALAYSKLTRLQERVVVEEIEYPDAKKRKKGEPERNELTLDENGFVIKQVSANSVMERLFAKGSLPGMALKGGKSAEQKATPDSGRATKSKSAAAGSK